MTRAHLKKESILNYILHLRLCANQNRIFYHALINNKLMKIKNLSTESKTKESESKAFLQIK